MVPDQSCGWPCVSEHCTCRRWPVSGDFASQPPCTDLVSVPIESMCPQLYVPTDRICVPTSLCSHSSMFPHLYVPTDRICVPTSLCSRRSYLCSHISMFPHLYVPTALCSHRSYLYFPHLYVPTDRIFVHTYIIYVPTDHI